MHRTSSPGRWRLFIAFAILPPIHALVGFIAFPVAGFALLIGAMGVLVTLCGGVPVVFSLMKRGPVSFQQIAVAGVALGNVPFAIYAFVILVFSVGHLAMGTLWERLLPLSDLLGGVLRAVTMGSIMGITSAVVFWLAGLRGTDAGR